ncbi:hypothetical protein Tco_1438115 [Tanacetum coccineum]
MSAHVFSAFPISLRLCSGSLSSSEADSDGGVIDLAISLPLCLVGALDLVKDACFDGGAYDLRHIQEVSTAIRSRTVGESSVVGTSGIVTVVSWYGPSKMHFLKASPFGLVSMYHKKRDYH